MFCVIAHFRHIGSNITLWEWSRWLRCWPIPGRHSWSNWGM